MSYTIIRPSTREGWLQLREKGIGSSEVGTILGVNPWETPYQLWRRKKGLDPAIEENDAMRAGHILEGAVATYFEQETDKKVIKSSEGDWIAIDKDRDFLRVSPDRTYWLSQRHSKFNKGILECKTTQMDINHDELPQHWFCQLQYQLGVMGYAQGSIAWLTRGKNFGYVNIKFDNDFYTFMTSVLEKFWVDNILGNQEPEAVSVADMMIKFPRSSEKSIEATQEIIDAAASLRIVKQEVAKYTAQQKELESRIKAFMQDADTLCTAGSLVANPEIICTYKSAKESMKFDEKAFASEHPDVYQQYLHSVPGSRRFMLK